MYALANRIGPEELRIVATQLFVEMLKAGYTSVAEFHYLHRPGCDEQYAGANLLWEAIGNAAYFLTAIMAIPLGFHFYGMLGAVVAVAASDLPMYLVTVTGATREGISTWKQDLQATGIFLAFLGIGLALRTLIIR